MADHQMDDISDASHSISSISTISENSSIEEEESPQINWQSIANEVQKIPETFGINTTNRVTKLHRHIKKSDRKFNRLATRYRDIMMALNANNERLDNLIRDIRRDRKVDLAQNRNIYTKSYNRRLEGDDATLHNLVIVYSDNIEEIGTPIPNSPRQIQHIGNLSIADAEQILKYLGFQNFDDLRQDVHVRGVAARNTQIRLNAQREVRRQYGLALI